MSDISCYLRELVKSVNAYLRARGTQDTQKIDQCAEKLIEQDALFDQLRPGALNPIRMRRDPSMEFETVMFQTAEKCYLHLLQKKPRDFTSIVGWGFLAFPNLLKVAIQSNIEIPIIVSRQTEDDSSTYVEPAILVPFLRLSLALTYCEGDFFDPHKEFDEFKECIRLLCSLGANVNDRDEEGKTLLSRLLWSISPPGRGLDVVPEWDTDLVCKAIRFLIEMGAYPDLPVDVRTGDSALHIAMKRYEDPITSEMLEALMNTPFPIDLAPRNHEQKTPLFIAIAERVHPDGIRDYLELCKGYNQKFYKMSRVDWTVLQEESCARTPLLYQVAETAPLLSEFEEVMDLLIEYGADITASMEMIHGEDEIDTTVADAVIENRSGKFTERARNYFLRKRNDSKSK